MISVIVPIYNLENKIERCINSIINQTYTDFELILVDDGSTDKSYSICKNIEKKDSRITVFHIKNGGVSNARNFGIDHSNGDFITFCDGDDYLEKEYLELLVNTYNNNLNYEHIWCCFNVITLNSKSRNFNSKEPLLRFTVKDYMTLHEMWVDTSPWNKLYKADIIKNNHIHFKNDLSLGEDWTFNLSYLNVSNNFNILVITQPLYNYFQDNPDSLGSKYRSNLLEIYHFLNSQLYNQLIKWNVSNEQLDKFFNSQFYLYENVLKNTMKNKKKKYFQRIIENSKFLRSDDFKRILNKRNCFINPLYLKAYKSGHYSFIIFLDVLCKLKSLTNKKYKKWRKNV